MSDGKRPHVLWVVPRMIWPPASGGEIRVLSLMRRLAGDYRLSLLVPVPAGQETRSEATAMLLENRGIEKVHLVRSPGKPPLGFFERIKPPTMQNFYDPAISAALEAALSETKPDLVQLEFSEMGQYARLARRHAPVLFTEHDAGFLSRSRHYQRPEKSRFPGDRMLEWLRRCFYEYCVFRHCDRVIALSSPDAETFKRYTNGNKVRVVPTGVNLEDFPFQNLSGREPGSVVFVGFYPHYPNEDAAVLLASGILPRVLNEVPGARLRLVGSYPTPAVNGLAGENVDVVGPVEKVHPSLARARVFASPVRKGRGIKGKLLEAFASGTPVVASPQSCEAMPGLEDGKQLLIAEGEDAFARKIARLLNDDSLSERLAREARAYVEDRWDNDFQAEKLAGIYRELL